MKSDSEHSMIGDPALTKIIETAGLWEGDFGGASGRLRMLLSCGAMRARKCDDGSVEYSKADTFPQPEDPATWVDRTNAEIKRRVSDEQAMFTHEAKLRREAAATLNAPILAAQRADFAYLLDEHGLSPEKLAATIEAAVEKAMQAHGLQLETVSAGNGSRER
jgi:hypothetical protein